MLRAVVVSNITSSVARDAVRVTYDHFVGLLTSAALWTLALGLLIAAAALVTRREAPRITPASVAQRVRAFLEQEPTTTAGRLARGIGLLLLGLALVRFRDTAVPLLVGILGILVAYAGLVFVFQVIGRDPVTVDEQARERNERRHRVVVALAAAAGAFCLVAAIAVIRAGGDGTTANAADAPRACNGSALLCDHRLDQVAFPTTHNSMSNAADGFVNAQQVDGLSGQLDSGIRGLLVDLYEGTPWKDTVYTDFTSLRTQKLQEQVGADLEARARELRDIVGPPPGSDQSDLYLCHGFCELGPSPAMPQMQTLVAFLAAHPDEVVVVVLEDYIRPALIHSSSRTAASPTTRTPGRAHRGRHSVS